MSEARLPNVIADGSPGHMDLNYHALTLSTTPSRPIISPQSPFRVGRTGKEAGREHERSS